MTHRLISDEHATPQPMAQTVAGLERAGLVIRQPDPTDGRNRLVCLTDAALAVIAPVTQPAMPRPLPHLNVVVH
ncbi:MAG TPA: hypothetical protein VGI07_02325 [Solirubrobacteraceae bacterium]|jgi:DNA-binding MarR family transcriptional regulator